MPNFANKMPQKSKSDNMLKNGNFFLHLSINISFILQQILMNPFTKGSHMHLTGQNEVSLDQHSPHKDFDIFHALIPN